MSPGLTSQVLSAARPSALFPFPSAVLNNNNDNNKNPAPEGAPGSACSVGAPTELCFMHHRFNKHRQHPRRSPLPILPAEGTKLFPLLSSPPNPRLYQLSINKIQLQFGIRRNTLITKGWCNLITWYLFRGFISRCCIEEGKEGKMSGTCRNKPTLSVCWMAFLHNLTELVCVGEEGWWYFGPSVLTSDVVEIKRLLKNCLTSSQPPRNLPPSPPTPQKSPKSVTLGRIFTELVSSCA